MRAEFPLVPCPYCKGLWVGGAYHAPRWVVRDGRPVQVDCQGKDVPSD